MAKLVKVPTGEVAKRIAIAICERLDTVSGKRAVASSVRDMLRDAVKEVSYDGEIGSEKFLGWMRSLGIMYRVPGVSRYGIRKNWREAIKQADFDTTPGKFGSLRPEMLPAKEEATDVEVPEATFSVPSRSQVVSSMHGERTMGSPLGEVSRGVRRLEL